MITHFDDLPDGMALEADLCIIGAGAAGLCLAHEFLGTNRRVILLEGGDARVEPQSQDIYKSDIIGLHHRGIHEGRLRVLGGTTIVWSGQVLPLAEVDYLERPWVRHSGWPVARGELEPYYRRAEQFLGLGPQTYDEASLPSGRPALPPFDRDRLRVVLSQFSPAPDLARRGRSSLSRANNVLVLKHANVVRIQTDSEATAVEHVAIRSLGGRAGRVSARAYALCCGAIENARILLASDRVESCGIGNRHDLVGRFFQDHPMILGPAVHAVSDGAWRRAFLPFISRGIKRGPHLVLNEAYQRLQQTLQVAGFFGFDTAVDCPIESAKLLLRAVRKPHLRAGWREHLRNTLREPARVLVTAADRYLTGRSVFDNSGPMRLRIVCEQEPNPDSRVTLGERRDALGMRRAVLDWRIGELELHSIRNFARVVGGEFERLGIGRIDHPSCDESLVRDHFHQSGTTRMHEDPKQGVVDGTSRVHGIDNLFIGGSSVFPTGSWVNPTLTIIALSLRLADHLKSRLAGRAAASK
jgi:choline dehydrogenase-like flavoprotein